MLAVRLDWQFEAARDDNDIRFAHVVDSTGQPIAQDDQTLGTLAAGTRRVEQVTLQLPADLPAGDYRAYVGWYTYPDLTRFAVSSAVDGAADGLALVGEITVME
jgi:hypothetical protein